MASYIENNLINGEQVVYRSYLHWVRFFSWKALASLMIAPLIDGITSEFAVTNKRVIVKTGLFSIKTLEMNVSKVESINVDQSVLGRLLNYGSINIIGTGGTHEAFANISAPLTFRKQYQIVSNQ